MQISVSGLYEKSKIEILPFINQDPSNPNTIYPALYFAQQLTERHGLGINPVTSDQLLYIKAVKIVMSSPDLPNIFVRLGGFHLLMSYMGSLGFIMAGSRLESMWETVYAPNSIQHMLTGHAYSRALRAHILSSAAISSFKNSTRHGQETQNTKDGGGGGGGGGGEGGGEGRGRRKGVYSPL